MSDPPQHQQSSDGGDDDELTEELSGLLEILGGNPETAAAPPVAGVSPQQDRLLHQQQQTSIAAIAPFSYAQIQSAQVSAEQAILMAQTQQFVSQFAALPAAAGMQTVFPTLQQRPNQRTLEANFRQTQPSLEASLSTIGSVESTAATPQQALLLSPAGSNPSAASPAASPSSAASGPKILPVKRGPRNSFPIYLHKMLESAEAQGFSDIVSWQPDGLSFLVHDRDRFIQEVMPKFFQQSRFSSFQRQLSFYKFQRVVTGPNLGAYHHEHFRRGMPHLVHKIARLNINKSGSPRGAGTGGSRDLPVQDDRPNFYAMTPLMSLRLDAATARVPSKRPRQEPAAARNTGQELAIRPAAPEPLPAAYKPLVKTGDADQTVAAAAGSTTSAKKPDSPSLPFLDFFRSASPNTQASNIPLHELLEPNRVFPDSQKADASSSSSSSAPAPSRKVAKTTTSESAGQNPIAHTIRGLAQSHVTSSRMALPFPLSRMQESKQPSPTAGATTTMTAGEAAAFARQCQQLDEQMNTLLSDIPDVQHEDIVTFLSDIEISESNNDEERAPPFPAAFPPGEDDATTPPPARAIRPTRSGPWNQPY